MESHQPPNNTQRLLALERQVARLDRRLEQLAAVDRRFFWYRLGALIGGGLFSFFAVYSAPAWFGQAAVLLSIVFFAVVVYFHRQVDRNLECFRLARSYANTQAARIKLDWSALPKPPAGRAADLSEHPFARDLNLAGERSLHQLIDTATSQGGSQRLRDWLLMPVPDPRQISQRRLLVSELAPMVGFRSRLALTGAQVLSKSQERWEGQRLIHWLETHTPDRSLRNRLFLLSGLALINWVLLFLSVTGALPPVWVISFSLYTLVYILQYGPIAELFTDAYDLGRLLEQLRAILVYLEKYGYAEGSQLRELAEPFWKAQHRPSQYLKGIGRVVSGSSLRNNPFVWVALNAALPWDMYFAYRLDQLRLSLRDRLPLWLDRWYTLEASSSIANFAHLNPAYTFPIIDAPADQEAVFSASSMGHPLIPSNDRVSNDFAMSSLGEVVIITGSNMSGKSTFLRTVGANLCLAYAGAPVCARYLKTIPFRVFTCMQVSDSLSDGISYFYAEVRRLKALLNALEQPAEFPLFYLIDEIFRGTNNREREAGSRAYVRQLASGYGCGLISTHDLELAHLDQSLSQVRNLHFREDVQAGRMVFDYRLRPGPSPTTNALKIMQLEGLPVEAGPAKNVSQ